MPPTPGTWNDGSASQNDIHDETTELTKNEDASKPIKPKGTQKAGLTGMRRSCQFCRKRKIKCVMTEKNTPCTPCAIREQDCIFAPMGAPEDNLYPSKPAIKRKILPLPRPSPATSGSTDAMPKILAAVASSTKKFGYPTVLKSASPSQSPPRTPALVRSTSLPSPRRVSSKTSSSSIGRTNASHPYRVSYTPSTIVHPAHESEYWLSRHANQRDFTAIQQMPLWASAPASMYHDLPSKTPVLATNLDASSSSRTYSTASSCRSHASMASTGPSSVYSGVTYGNDIRSVSHPMMYAVPAASSVQTYLPPPVYQAPTSFYVGAAESPLARKSHKYLILDHYPGLPSLTVKQQPASSTRIAADDVPKGVDGTAYRGYIASAPMSSIAQASSGGKSHYSMPLHNTTATATASYPDRHAAYTRSPQAAELVASPLQLWTTLGGSPVHLEAIRPEDVRPGDAVVIEVGEDRQPQSFLDVHLGQHQQLSLLDNDSYTSAPSSSWHSAAPSVASSESEIMPASMQAEYGVNSGTNSLSMSRTSSTMSSFSSSFSTSSTPHSTQYEQRFTTIEPTSLYDYSRNTPVNPDNASNTNTGHSRTATY